LTGLYDHQGMLRFSGRDRADCLAYAELFGIQEGTYSIQSLGAVRFSSMAESEAEHT